MQATGQPTVLINLQFLMADILEETRNTASTAYKSTHKTNLKGNSFNKEKNSNSKDTRNSGPKSSKKPNSSNNRGKDKEREKENRGQRRWPKNKDKESQGQKSSDFACAISTFNIATGGYSSADEELCESFSSPSDSESENEIELALNSKRNSRDPEQAPKGPPSRDSLLYDTGSTVHIINAKKWFTDYRPNNGNLGVVYTGGGPIRPKGIGTAIFEVLVKAPDTYRQIKLLNALYIPKLDVNLMSGLRHYHAKGFLNKNILYSGHGQSIGLLNPSKTGFFSHWKPLRHTFLAIWLIIAPLGFKFLLMSLPGLLIGLLEKGFDLDSPKPRQRDGVQAPCA